MSALSPQYRAHGAGVVASYFGRRWSVFFGALIMIAVWLWTYLRRDRVTAALETQRSQSDA